MKYTNYTNLDSHFMRAYEPGDRLVRGYEGELPNHFALVVDEATARATAEVVFWIHNRDDRPDGQLCPSMSVGDVVVFGEMALSAEPAGWRIVQLDAADLVTDRTWSDMVRS
jgi:hypothetical protein